jgi:hypothetical protein
MACLRIIGATLAPREVTRALQCKPTRWRRRGDPIYNRRGVLKGEMTYGYWELKAQERAPGDLSAQIEELLARVTDDLAVWRDLTSQFEADFFCGLFMGDLNDVLILKPALLGAIAARGIELFLDVYSDSKDWRRWDDGEFVGNGSDYD